jgi:hypothetical protein
VFRSLNSEPPWVEAIQMDEMWERSLERESQLRPLTVHVQDTSDDILFERFRQYLLERNSRLGLDLPPGKLWNELGQTELDEFKGLVCLAVTGAKPRAIVF